MALKRVNFVLTTPYSAIWTPDVEPDLAATNMPASLAEDDANVLRDGEWLKLASSNGKASRGTVAAAGGAVADVALTDVIKPAYVLYAEKGRSDIITGPRMPIIKSGVYEANTLLFSDTSRDTDKLAATFTLGMPLVAAQCSVAGETYTKFCGLYGLAAGQKSYVVGYVTRLPADNNGFLRFHAIAGGFGQVTA